MKLQDKTVIVTGGCGGFGNPLVQRLTAEGAQVGVFDIDRQGLEALADQDRVSAHACDLCSQESINTCVEEFFGKHGRIDALVNNAGILYNEPLVKFGPGGLVRHSPETWRRVMAVNLDAVFMLTAAVVEKMLSKRTRGVIVNISSISAQGNPGQSAYAASKAAVEALTKTWAHELGMLGIRVTCVAPGYSDTSSTHAVMPEKALETIVSEVPLRRLGKSEEIVDGVLFCLTNGFFNGKVLSLDGGLVF